MKKGLRPKNQIRLGDLQHLNTWPDEEGIKTYAPTNFYKFYLNTWPDEEGIKTFINPAHILLQFIWILDLMKKGLRRMNTLSIHTCLKFEYLTWWRRD